jgi:hypothetical protein
MCLSVPVGKGLLYVRCHVSALMRERLGTNELSFLYGHYQHLMVLLDFRSSQRSWMRHYATSQKVVGSIPVEVIGFFNLPNPSSRIMALWSTQPLTELSSRNLPGGNGRPARKAEKLSTLCEPIV